MFVAQGVSPGELEFLRFSSPLRIPPPRAAECGGGDGWASFRPRADALGYTYSAPLGLKPYPEFTLS